MVIFMIVGGLGVRKARFLGARVAYTIQSLVRHTFVLENMHTSNPHGMHHVELRSADCVRFEF